MVKAFISEALLYKGKKVSPELGLTFLDKFQNPDD